MSSERRPTLAEMTRRHIAGAASEWHHCKVGVVTAVDTSTSPPRVSVKPLVKVKVPDTEDGSRQVESLAIITNVPVQFMGAGGFRLTCPLSDGTLQINGETIPATMGTIWFSDESLDRWLSGTGAEVDPQIDHRFSINDGIFMPGLLPFGSPLAGWPQDRLTIGFDTGAQLQVFLQSANGLIQLMGPASQDLPTPQPLILSKPYLAYEQDLLTALATFATAIGALLPPLDPGPGPGTILSAITNMLAGIAAEPGVPSAPPLLPYGAVRSGVSSTQ